MESLLIAVLGALVGSWATIAFTFWNDKFRHRQETAIFVSAWVDECKSLLMQLQNDTQTQFKNGETPSIEQTDIALRKMTSKDFSYECKNRIWLYYYDQIYLDAWEAVLACLWRVRKQLYEVGNWPSANAEMNAIMDNEFEAKYFELRKLLFDNASPRHLYECKIAAVADWYRRNALAPKSPDRV